MEDTTPACELSCHLEWCRTGVVCSPLSTYITELQNHKRAETGKKLWSSSSPIQLKQGHLDLVAYNHEHVAF